MRKKSLIFKVKMNDFKIAKHISLALTLIISVFLISPVFSQIDDEGVELLLGELRNVPVDNPTRVAIDNPDIADVEKATATEVFITGKSLGETNLRIWDGLGNPRAMTIRVFEEDLDNLRVKIENILFNIGVEDLNVETKKDEQKIYIYGSVNPEQKDVFSKALEPFFRDIVDLTSPYEERGLVQVDVQILELTKEAQKQLGFNWIDALQLREEPYVSGSSSSSGVSTTKDMVGKFNTLFKVTQWSRDALTVKLSALESEGKLKVLSRPKLVCLSGKEANFLVGGEVPIVSEVVSSTGNKQTSVEYKEYGISLKINPVITKDNRIRLMMNTEVTDVNLTTAKGAAQYSSTLIIPAFEKRSAQSELYLKDQQSVFIAGLIKNKTDEEMEKVPWLGSIPVLGLFFRSRGNTNTDTELVISLTPKIVSDKVDKNTILVSEDENSDASLYAAIPTELRGYIYSLKRRVNHAVEYPKLAKDAGYEGLVRLGVHILSSGKIEDVVVTEQSGYKILDDAAVKTIKSMRQVPPFPREVQAKDIWIDIPIFYRVD